MARKRKQRRYVHTTAFRDELIDLHQQGNHDWHPWPGQSDLSIGVRNVYRTRIKQGDMWGEGFEARVRGGELECRYRPGEDSQ